MSNGDAKTTEAVLKHHDEALVSRNIEGIMEDYVDDSVIFTPSGSFKGLDAIRANFTGVLQMMAPEVMANMKTIKQDIDGEYGYVLWSAAPAIPFAGDTFHVHNGKIVMQSVVLCQAGS